MDHPRVYFGDVRISFAGPGADPERAERVARLMFLSLQELMERELQQLAADVVIDALEVTPVRMSLATADDETIARLGAASVWRAVAAAL